MSRPFTTDTSVSKDHSDAMGRTLERGCVNAGGR